MMNKIVIQPSKKKIFRRAISILIFIIFFLIIMYGFIPKFNNKLLTTIILLSIATLPNIILLSEYLVRTLNLISAEFTETGFKVFYKNGTVDDYNYSDLKVVKLYKAAGMDKGNYSFNSNEQYYFAKIVAKNGKNIILTSLLGPDLSDALNMINNVPVERTKTGYAFIFFGSR